MKILFLFLFSLTAYAQVEGVYQIRGGADLAPLAKLTAGAEIVALGESGHGSSGFLRSRLDLIKYYVTEHGFRTVILENGYYQSEDFYRYLQKCTVGTNQAAELLALVRRMDIIYRNQEMLETFTWMCDYNRLHPEDALSFHGMDIWETPWNDRNVINELVTAVQNPSLSATFDLAKENCWAWKANSWAEASTFQEWANLLRTWRIAPTRHYECLGALTNLRMTIAKNRTALEESAGNDKVYWANLAIRVQETYQQYRDLYQVDLQRVLNLRDTMQAELTLAQQSRHANKKVILMAHNIHVAKKQSAIIVRHPGPQQWNNVRSTGEILRGHLGKKYKSIALTGYKVSSSRDGDYPLPTVSDSLDLTLSTLGEYLLVDPNAAWIQEVGEWWMHGEMDEEGSLLVPREQYDAIIFLKESARATELSQTFN